jgi:hypothetical protein
MRKFRGDSDGCDGLDLAAVWPASASVAGIPLPEIGSGLGRGGERMKDKKEAQ